MDIKQKKMILNNYRHLEKELDEKFHHYKEARSKLDGVAAQIIDDMPKGSAESFDKFSGKLARLEDLEVTYNKVLAERKRIEKSIENIEDAVLRRILVSRYMDCISFEQIAVNIGYTYRHTKRLHKKALIVINLG